MEHAANSHPCTVHAGAHRCWGYLEIESFVLKVRNSQLRNKAFDLMETRQQQVEGRLTLQMS